MVLLHCGVGKNWAGPFFPPSKMLGSFYLSSRLLDYVILLLYLNSLDLYQAENQVFKPTHLFVIVGWGKTGPAHSFPLLNLSIFYWSFRLSVYVTLSLYFNIYERTIPKWESSFQSNKIIGTSTLLGGEIVGRPILSPLQNLQIFLFISYNCSLSVYVTLSLYLNTYEWPIPKRESSFQTKHFICTATLWGGERLGRPILPPPPPPPLTPPKCSDLSIYLSVFQLMLFF